VTDAAPAKPIPIIDLIDKYGEACVGNGAKGAGHAEDHAVLVAKTNLHDALQALAKLVDDACAASYWHGNHLRLPGNEHREAEAGRTRNALCAAIGIKPETPWPVKP
jgi:hypothetical protein